MVGEREGGGSEQMGNKQPVASPWGGVGVWVLLEGHSEVATLFATVRRVYNLGKQKGELNSPNCFRFLVGHQGIEPSSQRTSSPQL